MDSTPGNSSPAVISPHATPRATPANFGRLTLINIQTVVWALIRALGSSSRPCALVPHSARTNHVSSARVHRGFLDDIAIGTAAATQRSSNYRDFVLVQATRESEAVPHRRRACALTTRAPSALQSGSSGNYRQISLRSSSTGGHAPCICRPLSPPVCGQTVPRSRGRRSSGRIHSSSSFSSSREAMDERIPHLQDRQFMEHADFLGWVSLFLGGGQKLLSNYLW